MAKIKSDFKTTVKNTPKIDESFDTMKKGYLEMAEINLAISRLFFEVESEVLFYIEEQSGE